jgi:hypothetical protein
MLSAVGRKSGLRVLSVSLNVAGEAMSLAYRDGGTRVADGDRPLFATGCVMDMIFAIICLDLHHRLGLRLDEPFETYVPEAAPLIETEGAGPITIQHLLTRTSGIQDPRTIKEMRSHVPWAELAPRVRDAPRLFSPGSAFSHGGIDRSLLAVALLRFSGKSFVQLADEIISKPCGIEVREEQYGPVGEDGVRRVARSDPAYIARVAACLAGANLGPEGPAFSEGVRTYLQIDKLQLSRSIKAPPWPHMAANFTMGLFKYSDGLIGFNGFESGEACSVRYDPVDQLGFSVALEGPPGVRDYIIAVIAECLGYFGVQSRAVPCTVGGLNGLRPDDIAGDYLGWASGYRAGVTLEGNTVACHLTYGAQRFRVMKARMEDNAWLVVDTAAELTALEFYRDPRTGRVCMASGGAPYAMTERRLDA